MHLFLFSQLGYLWIPVDFSREALGNQEIKLSRLLVALQRGATWVVSRLRVLSAVLMLAAASVQLSCARKAECVAPKRFLSLAVLPHFHAVDLGCQGNA